MSEKGENTAGCCSGGQHGGAKAANELGLVDRQVMETSNPKEHVCACGCASDAPREGEADVPGKTER